MNHGEAEKMLVGEVARLLGCSTARVRQLDATLQPERVAGAGLRLYRRALVEAFAIRREQQRKAGRG